MSSQFNAPGYDSRDIYRPPVSPQQQEINQLRAQIERLNRTQEYLQKQAGTRVNMIRANPYYTNAPAYGTSLFTRPGTLTPSQARAYFPTDPDYPWGYRPRSVPGIGGSPYPRSFLTNPALAFAPVRRGELLPMPRLAGPVSRYDRSKLSEGPRPGVVSLGTPEERRAIAAYTAPPTYNSSLLNQQNPYNFYRGYVGQDRRSIKFPISNYIPPIDPQALRPTRSDQLAALHQLRDPSVFVNGRMSPEKEADYRRSLEPQSPYARYVTETYTKADAWLRQVLAFDKGVYDTPQVQDVAREVRWLYYNWNPSKQPNPPIDWAERVWAKMKHAQVSLPNHPDFPKTTADRLYFTSIYPGQ